MEYKHFSHTHGLILHQVPGESQITCSGCKFLGNGPVYACWPCSFFLHEQCFHATRSMNHPSHPTHPLTLVPYPTYPSNSFFCNFCNLVGSGMSYSCSACEFDIHVHCALTPSITTTQNSFPSSMTLNYPIPNEPNSEINPISTYPPHNYETSPSFVPQTGSFVADQHHAGQLQYTSYHTGDMSKHNYFPGEPIPVNDHILFDHSRRHETIPNFNPEMNNAVIDQHQDGQPHRDGQLQYTSYQTGDQSKHSYCHGESIPANDHILIDQSRHHETIPKLNPQIDIGTVVDQYQAGPPHSVPYPLGDEVSQTKSFPTESRPVSNHIPIMHFSHDHPLRLSEFKEDDSIICSGCEEDLSGPAYSCITSECDFNLHKSCFELKRQLEHECHPQHPLSLLSSPPYEEHNEFTCNACFNTGSSFTYHCKTCQFDLHVNCASLPKTEKREDHEHPLILLYSVPLNKPKEGEEEGSFSCDVCYGTMDENCWLYYCKKCDFGTHLECVHSEPRTYAESLIAAQNQMQLLNFQMKMSRQNAEFMAGLGKSMLSLV